MKLKVSTQTEIASKLIGEERTIEYIARAGFDAYDLSMFEMAKYDKATGGLKPTDHPFAGKDYLSYVRRLRRVAEDNGIICNQTHAPFPTSVGCVRDYLKRAIECSAEVGAEYCIIHPANNGTPEENAEFYHTLLPFAKEHGVKIATENMWNWNREEDHAVPAACSRPDNFVAHLDAVNDDYLVACLDIGHSEMFGLDTSAPELIDALGCRLKALHIHDNDKLHDSHQIPFSMNIDFGAVIDALRRNNYRGYLTLEADNYLKDRTAENMYEGICDLAAAVKRLSDMFGEF